MITPTVELNKWDTKVVIQLSFSLPIDDAGVAIDEAVNAGASRVDGITFTLRMKQLILSKQEALRKATIDAKTKTETVLSTLNLTLKEIIRIEIDRACLQAVKPATNSRRRRRARSSSAAPGDDSGFEMPVVGGELAVDASVTLEIIY